jgi:hypothetical protein
MKSLIGFVIATLLTSLKVKFEGTKHILPIVPEQDIKISRLQDLHVI